VALAKGSVLQYRFVLSGISNSVRLPSHSLESWWLTWTKEDGITLVQIGANLSFPQEFGIEDNTWLTGVINSG